MKKLFVYDGKMTPIAFLLNALILFFVFAIIINYALDTLGLKLDFSFLILYKNRIFDGFLLTIYISIASLISSLIIGIVFAFFANSKIIILKVLSEVYVKIIRGTPLIAQIYLFYYIIGTAFGVTNRFLAGVIILSIFEGAYIAEIIRGSLLSIENSQLEIAKSVGFTKRQTLTNVIIPQLFARTLPSLTGQFASIIKDSSLLSIIAVIEATQTMREITATNYKFFEAYLFLSVLYLALTLPLSFISEKLERKFNYANND